jgi:serine protease Do
MFVSLLFGYIGGSFALSHSPSFFRNQESSLSDSQHTTVQTRIEVVNEESQVIKAIEKISPSVVSIVITKELQVYRSNPSFSDDPFFFFDPFSQLSPNHSDRSPGETELRQVGGGTGFIFTEDGLILTNKHVVADSKASYTVILQNGDEYPAEVVDRDMLTDIAVVRILTPEGKSVPRNLPVVEFGSSQDLKVGQRVIAIGNALSEFSNTVTVGVVSAKERSIVATDGFGGGENLSNLIQTDAAINPGNSGGPLVNISGQVVGVNTAIAAGANGLGFAIPISDITLIIESVKKSGKIIRPVLGVRFVQLNEKIAEEYGIEGITEGALLIGNGLNKEFAVIPGQPAALAGLKEGDVIISIDGKNITDKQPLQSIIAQRAVGDMLNIKYFRNGKMLEVSVKLGDSSSLGKLESGE